MYDKIDFDDPRIQIAIDNFDLYSFLDDHNISYKTEGKNIGENFIGIEECPNPSCGDTKYHAAIHKDKKFLSCFKCKCYYPLPSIIAAIKKIRLKHAVQFLIESVEDENLDIVDRVKLIFKKKGERENPYTPIFAEQLPENRKIRLSDFNNPYLKPFFKERKIHPCHVDWYDLRLGIKKDSGKIIFPIYSNGKLMTYQSRMIQFKRYNTGKIVPRFLVNEDHIHPKKPLVYVEGFFDFLSVDTVIRKRFQNKISATTGLVKMLSRHQLQKIVDSRPSKLISLLDYDAWHDYGNMQKNLPMDVEAIILPKGKDPNDLPLTYIEHILKNILNGVM